MSLLQTPGPFSVTAQSKKGRSIITGGELLVEAQLVTSYRFNTPRYARLFAVTGLKEPVFVFASFAALTPLDNSYRRLLGLSTATPGAPVLVEGGFISSLTDIQFAKLDGTPFEKIPEENIVVHIQIAPSEWLSL